LRRRTSTASSSSSSPVLLLLLLLLHAKSFCSRTRALVRVAPCLPLGNGGHETIST
jgi:hypothetical protein